MTTTKLSTKGQVILPKAIRDAHGWTAGKEFTVEDTPQGVLLRPVRRLPATQLKDLAGILKRPGQRPATIEDMDAAIAAEVKRRHARGRY